PSAVSFGLAVPTSLCGFDERGRDVRPAALAEWMEILEAPGVESLWVLDQLAGGMATPEPLSFLSHVAALTSRVRLGVAVLIAAARGPVVAAKTLATLDWLSNGRLDVGLGLGPFRYFPAYGVDRVRGGGYRAILDEFVEILQQLWTGAPASFDGRS